MQNLKIKPIRSKSYLKWIREQPCCQCGVSEVDPHHCIGFDGIMGDKADDSMAVPLCRTCHTDLHNDYGWDKQGILQAQMKWLQWTLRKAVCEGVIKI